MVLQDSVCELDVRSLDEKVCVVGMVSWYIW